MCIDGMRVSQTDRRKGNKLREKDMVYTETEKKTSTKSQITKPHECQECKYYILLSTHRCALCTDISIRPTPLTVVFCQVIRVYTYK